MAISGRCRSCRAALYWAGAETIIRSRPCCASRLQSCWGCWRAAQLTVLNERSPATACTARLSCCPLGCRGRITNSEQKTYVRPFYGYESEVLFTPAYAEVSYFSFSPWISTPLLSRYSTLSGYYGWPYSYDYQGPYYGPY